jgi:hypothetical protein
LPHVQRAEIHISLKLMPILSIDSSAPGPRIKLVSRLVETNHRSDWRPVFETFIIEGVRAAREGTTASASQLRTAGQEVSLLAMLGTPNPAGMEPRDSLAIKVSYLRYALGRAARLGPRPSLAHLREYLFRRFARSIGTKPANTEMGGSPGSCSPGL